MGFEAVALAELVADGDGDGVHGLVLRVGGFAAVEDGGGAIGLEAEDLGAAVGAGEVLLLGLDGEEGEVLAVDVPEVGACDDDAPDAEACEALGACPQAVGRFVAGGDRGAVPVERQNAEGALEWGGCGGHL